MLRTHAKTNQQETTLLALPRRDTLLSPGQTDSQVDASEGKFAKPELAYGLASRRKWVAFETQVERKPKTCVDLRVRLSAAFF